MNTQHQIGLVELFEWLVSLFLGLLKFIFIDIPMWILGLAWGAGKALFEFFLDGGETVLDWLRVLVMHYWWVPASAFVFFLLAGLINYSLEQREKDERERKRHRNSQDRVASLRSERDALYRRLRQVREGQP